MGGFRPAIASDQEPEGETLFQLLRRSIPAINSRVNANVQRYRQETGFKPTVGAGPAPSSPAPSLEPDRSMLGPVPPFNVAVQQAMSRGLGAPDPLPPGPPMRTDSTPGPIDVKPSMRAIRMPNGTVLFTNRDEIGGDEFVGGTAAAGREIRSMDRARATSPTQAAMLNVVREKASDVPGALVNASQDQARLRGEGSMPGPPALEPTRRVAGQAPDTRPGVSFIEGTPEQQREIALRDMMDVIAMEQAGQELEVARMPPGEAAALSNPTVQSGNWIVQNIGPELDRVTAVGQEKARQVMNTIADPKLRQQELARIEAETEARRRNLIDLMSAITRQTIAPF